MQPNKRTTSGKGIIAAVPLLTAARILRGWCVVLPYFVLLCGWKTVSSFGGSAKGLGGGFQHNLEHRLRQKRMTS